MTTTLIEHGTASPLGPSLVECQRDSFMRSFESIVTQCKQWSLSASVDTKRKGKKGKKRKSKEKYYEIELRDTILFPEGGGQPTDNGVLSVIDDNDDQIQILSVYRTSDGRVLHKANKSIAVGSKIRMELNWSRRWDHMQQHTAQHLISAVFKDELKTPTISWWMSEAPKASQIEMQMNKDEKKEINEDKIMECERRINKIISDARVITVHVFHDKSSIESFACNHTRFKNKELPDGAGPLRVVQIPDIEYNTCCGTHLGNTAQLQMIKITACDVANDTLKVQFVAGQRIERNYSTMYDRERQIGKLLSCGNDEYVANIDKTQKEIKSKTSELRAIEKRLIELEIDRFTNLIQKEFKGKKVKCIYEHFVYGNMKMMQLMIDGVLNKCEDDKDSIIFIMFSMGISTKSGAYLMATNDDKLLSPKNKKCKQQILSIIEGSGGGKPGRLQGKAKNFKAFPQLFEFVHSLYTNETEDERKEEQVATLNMDKVTDSLSGLNQIIDTLQHV